MSMPERLARNPSMLFTYGSTYKTDYNDGEITPVVKTEYKDFIHHKPRPEFKPLKDTHAMTDYRDARVPFTLFWDLDPILRKPFKLLEKPCNETFYHEREEAQRTRPRVLITPAEAIDNIVDKEARKHFVEDMYTTQMARGLQQGLPEIFNVRAPYPGTNAPTQPITLPVYRPALVLPEWRMDSVKQDSEYFRGYCDATKEFWLRHPLNDCSACDETKIIIDHRRKERQRKLKGKQRVPKPPFNPF